MLPPPPRSTLFPYTTLFRSETDKLKVSLRQLNDRIEEAKRKKNILIARQKRAEAHKRIQETDRKSTRLNSSHGSISYAVFCLKKKKKKKQKKKEREEKKQAH